MSHNEYSQQLAYDAEQKKTTQGITDDIMSYKKENPSYKQGVWKFLPQTRMGECEGCKMICEECERLHYKVCSDGEDETITEEDEKNAKCELCGVVGISNHNFWLDLDKLLKGERLCYGLCGECDPPEEE